jgi:hypothetical protein
MGGVPPVLIFLFRNEVGGDIVEDILEFVGVATRNPPADGECFLTAVKLKDIAVVSLKTEET